MPKRKTATEAVTTATDGVSDRTEERTEKTMGTFADRLAKLQEGFTTAAANAGKGFNDVDPGLYVCVLDNAEVKESGQGKLQIVWSYIVLEGDLKGEPITIYQGLETEKNLEFVSRDLRRFGVDVANFDLGNDLEPTLKELTANRPVTKLQVKINGDYKNVYLQAILAQTEDEYDG